MKNTQRICAVGMVLGFATLLLGAAPPVDAARSAPSEARGNPDGTDAQRLTHCVSWDIKDLCCPGYCAAKNGRNWPKANDIFDACIVSIGCQSKHTTGYMSCDCPKQ